VLLAEDHPVNRMVAERMLQKYGHRVTSVETGRAAVDMARTHRFDVILMDVQMPELDGLGATRAIRAFEKETGIVAVPVIALTAHAMDSDAERCRDAGMDAHLPKPFSGLDIERTIRELTNARAGRPAAAADAARLALIDCYRAPAACASSRST
jgi:CheY-like chemotaxis protein